MKHITTLLLALLLIGACGNTATAPDVTNTHVKQIVTIGASLPLTGDVAFLGEGSRNAILLALEDLKKRDTQYEYKVIFEDDKIDAKTASTVATKFTTVDDVDAIISLSSGVGNAISPIAESSKTIHFGIASDANVEKGEYNFIHWTQPNEEARIWVKQAIADGHKRLAILTMQQEGNIAIAAEVKRQLASSGLEVVNDQTFDPAEKDFRTIVVKAQEAKPDLYLVLAFDPTLPLLYKQMKTLGVSVPITAIEGFELSSDIAVYEGEWYVNAADGNSAFNAKYQTVYGKDPVLGAGNAYDSFNLIVEGFERAGKDSAATPSTQDVVTELMKIAGFQGALGSLDMGADSIVRSEAVVKVIENGKMHVKTSDSSPTGAATSTLSTSSDPIKVGWIGPLTGTGAAYGVPELRAAKMALLKINSEGGVNGRSIELIVEDAKCDGALATTSATKLVEVDSVKYILGGHCSTESLSIVPITESKKVFLLAGATGSNAFSGAGKYAFRTFPSAKVLYGNLAEFAIKEGVGTVATLSEEKDWPASVIDSFVTRFAELGGMVLIKETFPAGTTDFKTSLLKISQKKPDAIMLSVQGPDSAALIIKQMDEMKLTIPIYGDSLVVSKATYDKSEGKLPSSAIGGTPHIDLDSSPLTKHVIEQFVAQHGSPGLDNIIITEGYDDMMIISELLKSCGEDTDCARKEMLSRKWIGATGTIMFDEQGDPTPYVGVVRIVDGKQVFLQ